MFLRFYYTSFPFSGQALPHSRLIFNIFPNKRARISPGKRLFQRNHYFFGELLTHPLHIRVIDLFLLYEKSPASLQGDKVTQTPHANSDLRPYVRIGSTSPSNGTITQGGEDVNTPKPKSSPQAIAKKRQRNLALEITLALVK